MKKENTEQQHQEEMQEQVDKTLLQACQEELEVWKEKSIRISADLENFRRRMEKERLQWMQVAQADIMKDLLAIVDDFDRALEQKNKQEIPQDLQVLFSGFDMISTALTKMLNKFGVEEITECTVFDPTLHEAVVQVESDQHKSGDIVVVLQKGYRFKEQVIRPAMVSVAK